jgi:ATP-binding cassette subfamily B protein
MAQLLSVGTDVEASLALFDRIFEYLDLPVDIVEKPGARWCCAPSELLGEVALEDVGFRYGDQSPWTLHDIDLVVPAGTRTASSARPARARRRSATSLRGCMSRRPGG